MDGNNYKQQEEILHSLKEGLTKKYASMKAVENIGESVDDNAWEVSEASTKLSLKKDIEREIKQIDLALKAIANGKYGSCQNCGVKIESSRLKLVPTALFCSSCQNNRSHKK